jgi:transposase
MTREVKVASKPEALLAVLKNPAYNFKRIGLEAEAIVALARRLAVIMHRIWVDGTEFCWTREQATAAA